MRQIKVIRNGDYIQDLDVDITKKICGEYTRSSDTYFLTEDFTYEYLGKSLVTKGRRSLSENRRKILDFVINTERMVKLEQI
jgi:hypothetical protein